MDKNNMALDTLKFSVLLSIYYNESPKHFNRAMQSIWDDQTMKPSEIILVQDGILTDELYDSIGKWKEKLDSIFKTIALKKNVGLGDALNIGLKECSYELIARMDTDDICRKDRFEKQLKVFETNDVDACSSWVSEFDNNEKIIVSYRKLPENHQDILTFGAVRNPINHPAVMYKKSVVLKAGGYKKMMWFEDYHLWARMILNNAKFYNIQEPLVNMRAGYGQIERRSGFKYAKAELHFLKELLNIGFLTPIQFIKSIALRFTIRIIPKKLIGIVYKVFLRR